jgi:hypothetical protein
MDNVLAASPGLAVFWLMFFTGLSGYYLKRTLYTVRRLLQCSAVQGSLFFPEATRSPVAGRLFFLGSIGRLESMF